MRTVKEREILKADSKKGLNDFMSRVTSEDNVSFDELCTLQNIAQRIKHYWIFKAETEAHSSFAIQDSRNENSNSLELALKDSSIDTGKTKHSVPLDTWPYQARNMLMFNPDGIDVALQDKMADAKKSTMQIVHNNTRFAPGFLEEQQKQAKLTDHIAQTKAMKRGNIGPDGKEIVPDNENDPNAKYSFLATPSPMPGHGKRNALFQYLHKQCLCYSMNYLFSNLIRKYCCDANIVAMKCVHFESVHFDQ